MDVIPNTSSSVSLKFTTRFLEGDMVDGEEILINVLPKWWVMIRKYIEDLLTIPMSRFLPVWP